MNSGALLENWAWMAGAVAVNVLWQGIILAAVAAVALRILRTSAPEIRYRVALTALLGMVSLIPINVQFISFAPAQPLPLQADELTPVSADTPIQLVESKPAPVNETLPSHPASHQATPDTHVAGPSRPEIRLINWQDLVLPWAGRIWLVGIIAISGYDLLALFALTRLRRRGHRASPELLKVVERISKRMQVKTSVQVRIVEDLSSALVTGFFRVVVLLPAAMLSGLSPEGIEAIIAHELAHIRRWDRWFNGLQRIAEALLFFHPAVWWLSKVVRAEREMCCDAMVLRMGVNRVSYVQALFSLAQHSHREQSFGLSSHDGNLVKRVRIILHDRVSQSPPQQGSMAAAGTTALGLILPPLLLILSGVSLADGLPERVIQFPVNESVGTLYGRWADEEYQAQPWMPRHNEGWSIISEARGEIIVPENTQLKLNISTTNLRFLRNLDPDALYFIECHIPTLTDKDIMPISTLTGVRALDLRNNDSLTGKCLESLGSLRALEWLDFQRVSVEGLPENAFAQFRNLKYIAGHFKAQSDRVLEQLSGIETIEFAELKEGSVTPNALEKLSGKESLRGLTLENVQLTTEGLAALETIPNLLYLDIKKNELTDESLGHISNFPKLRHLGLRATTLTDSAIRYLANNPTLEDIVLTSNRITEGSLPTLATLPSLQFVELADTQIPEEISRTFCTSLAAKPQRFISAQKSDNPNAPKVGILMSYFTATGPFLIERPYGYISQDSDILARFMNEANFDVYAVIEPGTERLGELPGILNKHGLTGKTVDGYNPEELAKLDAVLIVTLYNAKSELLVALDQAIQHGVGLVNIGAIGASVGPLESNAGKRSLERITGMSAPIYTWQGLIKSECMIATAHPILGKLKPGSPFHLKPLDGLRSESGLPTGSTILIDAPPSYPKTFPVLYVRDHGKGRVVCGQWHRVEQPGIPFPGFSFYVRAINWAAHRDADTIW